MASANWTEIGTVNVFRKPNGRTYPNAGFNGKATIYRYEGEAIGKLKAPEFAVVVTFERITAGYHCVGHVVEALKDAAPVLRNARSAPMHDYVDWGGPIGKPDSKHSPLSLTHLFT